MVRKARGAAFFFGPIKLDTMDAEEIGRLLAPLTVTQQDLLNRIAWGWSVREDPVSMYSDTKFQKLMMRNLEQSFGYVDQPENGVVARNNGYAKKLAWSTYERVPMPMLVSWLLSRFEGLTKLNFLALHRAYGMDDGANARLERKAPEITPFSVSVQVPDVIS